MASDLRALAGSQGAGRRRRPCPPWPWRGPAGDKGQRGPAPYAPFGQADDVPRLDEAADLVPHADGDAARLVRHLAGPHLVPVLGLGDSPCGEKRGSGGARRRRPPRPP